MAKRNYKKKKRKKTTSWKRMQWYQQLKRRLRLLGLALLVVVSTVVVVAAINLYNFFARPMATASGAADQGVSWNGGRFNFLLIVLDDADDETSLIRELSLISLDSYNSRYSVVKLPLDAAVDVPGDFGVNPLRAVYALGALKKPQVNLKLTAQTVSHLLAVPIDGYILTDEDGLGSLGELLGEQRLSFRVLKLLPRLAVEARRQLKTDLKFSTLAQIGRFLWQAEPDSRGVIEVGAAELLDVGDLDWRLSGLLTDQKIVDERLKVQVLNGTAKSGLAGHVARYVKNLGGDVIWVGNYEPAELTKSVLVTRDPDSHTVKRLSEALGIEDIRANFEGVGERADLTIVVGLDSYYSL
jgi:hypothetical protein